MYEAAMVSTTIVFDSNHWNAFEFTLFFLLRGVQYVHWVMHKCIMVRVGGKRNTHKVCKKQVNFLNTAAEILKVEGEIIIFAKQRGMY